MCNREMNLIKKRIISQIEASYFDKHNVYYCCCRLYNSRQEFFAHIFYAHKEFSDDFKREIQKVRAKKRFVHGFNSKAIKIMHSYGVNINTDREKHEAIDTYKRICKRARRKNKSPLEEKEYYSSINQDNIPKEGSGFHVVSGSYGNHGKRRF